MGDKKINIINTNNINNSVKPCQIMPLGALDPACSHLYDKKQKIAPPRCSMKQAFSHIAIY